MYVMRALIGQYRHPSTEILIFPPFRVLKSQTKILVMFLCGYFIK